MNTTMKRVLSLVLCLVMLVGMMPMLALNADAAGETIYVLAGGDFQEGGESVTHDKSSENVANILAKISQKYTTMDGFLFVGDYDAETHENDDNGETAAGITALMDTVDNVYANLNDDNTILVQGNHDVLDSRIDATGGYDFDGYAVYVLNEGDYAEKFQATQAQIQTLAENMKTWLNNKLGAGYDAPIFITSHLPLAYGPRTWQNGDGVYAKLLFDVLNTAADNGLNIIFLHGHDHAYGSDNHLGGEAIYLAKGDKINIAELGNNKAWTTETLNFTYMNAGYVGYYNESGYNNADADDSKLTMTVFAITGTNVTVERYSAAGLYNLKSAGRDGYYSDTASSASKIGLTITDNVYSSPQIISLGNVETYGTIGEWVGVTAETPADDVATSNEGWVELIAPVPGTPEVPATPESTKYVYTLDTDGTVTDKESAAQGYLIVGSNSANAMTDSLGATGVNIESNAITLDAQPDYEWWITSDGKITDGTNYLKFTGTTSWFQPSGTVSVVTDASQATAWDIAHDGDGQYTISCDYTYSSFSSPRTTTYYLRYSNGFSVISSSNTVRLFLGEKVTVPATEGTPATPDTNGTYGKIVGDLTYNATVGMTADEAMALVKGGIDGYYYEAMSTPGSDVTGTKVEDDVLTWEWVDTFNGNTAGDYEVAIKYGDKLLATAEVVVPATKTYYIAEGNGMYFVDMNTSADAAMAVVKTGVSVSSATDANGTNKQSIDDSKVTWNWVDTYNGADSGPYTVEILYNGTSLGTVEVKVNVKYTTEINPDWTYIGEQEATGGKYYQRVENLSELQDGEQYLIIFDCSNQTDKDAFVIPTMVTYNSGSNARRGADVVVSDGITDNATITGDYDSYLWTFTKSGTGWIIGNGSQNVTVATNSTTNRGELSFTTSGETLTIASGSNSSDNKYISDYNSYGFAIYDSSNLYWQYNTSATLVYATSGDSYESRFVFYKVVEEEVTPGDSIYAKLEGNTVYTVDQGTSAYEALNTVKAGITAYTASDDSGTNKTEIADSDLTYKWKNTYTSSVTGSYWVEISYQGVVLGTVEVQVKPGVINNYPEYPDEGAVKVNKTGTGIDFQSSGIAQIEISASGVPMKRGADVIIMLDTSSSMTSHIITGGTKTRAAVLEESLVNLIAQFKTPGDDGQLLDIRVAIADFNGFYGDNHSASGTAYDRDAKDMMSDDISYNANSEAKVYTGDGTLGAGAFINVEDLADSYTLNYTSGTNYDYAFDAIYQLGTAIKSEDRDLFVIFMSDGAAMQWNYYHSQGASSLWNSWITGAWDASDLTTTNLNCTTHKHYYDEVDHNGDGMRNEHRMANAIKGSPDETFEVIRKVSGLGTATGEENMYMVPGLGATMFSISFDATTDTNVTEDSMDKSIASLASEQTGTTQYYYKVTSASELDDAFTAIGSEIAYAAYNARFVDQMGENYDLQMSTSTYKVVEGDTTTSKTLTPEIEIISYDIYTRQDFLNGTITEDKIGDRKDTYKILETVTFNEDGTEAYSSLNSTGPNGTITAGSNILIGGVIYANTFWYNTNANAVEITGVNIPTGINADGTTKGSTNLLPAETFYWKLGTVQTSELAMRYYVYLSGSMEGERAGGSYPTNEYATLYYDNYLHNPCYKDTVSPVMPWKEANVSYAFYLVDENGNIIVNQTTGQTGSFANKIAVTNPVLYKTVLLNNGQNVESLDIASLGVLPEGYTLYDATYDENGVATEGATYTVYINSNTTGSWEITTTKDVATTYVMQYEPDDASAYSNELIHDTVGDDYTHTVVWFAVLWEVQALPDSVVIDYGLPVDISVLVNDMFGENGKLVGVGACSDDLNLDGHETNLAAGFSGTYTGTYGTATADSETGKVRYTLNKTNGMQMNSYEKFAYAVNYTGNENAGYYYDTVTVIPATTIYYEESFLTFAKYNTQGDTDATNDVVSEDGWITEGTAEEGVQAEDRPGKYSLSDANNIYGFDAVNNEMSIHSLGSAAKVHVDASSYATASFTFYGTGFDVISMTSDDTGSIFVRVFDEDDNIVRNAIVDTYYGMEEDGTIDPNSPDAIYQVPVIKIFDLEYGQYTVVITATYAAALDHTEAEGYDLYLDAIRIYDPAGTTYDVTDENGNVTEDGNIDDVIQDAYIADGEGWPEYQELRDKVIAASNYQVTENEDGTVTVTGDEIDGVVFIDCNDGTSEIADYVSYGPNNELYLANGQSITFNVNLPENAADVQLGIKMANGEPVAYSITAVSGETTVNTVQKTVDTATDMYYSIKSFAESGTVVITNISGGILSLTNIKVTYTSAPVEASTASLMSMDAESVGFALMSLRAPVVEDDVPETTVPEETEPETTVPEETEPETTVPEETEPETTVPEETESEEIEQVVEVVKEIIKKLFGWLFG